MLLRELAGLLLSFFYKIYSSTFRYIVQVENNNLRVSDQVFLRKPDQKGFIYAFYHQDDFSFLPFYKDRNLFIMVSPSKDGTLLKKILEEFGYGIVQGSSNKGPIKAFLLALKKIKQGFSFAIAVDGPRGPLFKSKPGIIALSVKSKIEIIPVVAQPAKFLSFKKAWHQPRLPLPFTKIALIFGEPQFFTNPDELDSKFRNLKNFD